MKIKTNPATPQAQIQTQVIESRFQDNLSLARIITLGVAVAIAIVLAASPLTLKANAIPAHAAIDIGDINVNDGFVC